MSTLITAWSAATRALLAALVLLAAAFATASPAGAAIRINEIESQGAAATDDYVELVNTDTVAVPIGGYVISDDDDAHDFTVPAGTSLAAGGRYTAYVNTGATPFALGNPDQARLFDGGGTQLDSFAWANHASTTLGRCPDGTGDIALTKSATPDAPNDCPTPFTALAWPGPSTVAEVDDNAVFGGVDNLSGLFYEPSGTSARGVLWAVRNNPGTLYRLVYDGTKWTTDKTGGWSAGKLLRYPGGAGNPDAEGVTRAAGDPNGIFVAVERDGGGTSSPAVLRFDVSSAATTLTATGEWNLSADLPGLGANLGPEAIAWMPDALLVAKGLREGGAAYDPASHPGHGAGLFLVGVEQGGSIIAYALDQSSGSFTRVATIDSGFSTIMELEFEPETGLLWAICDNGCNGRTTTLDVAQSGPDAGRLVVTKGYERPTGMANLNNEGFAIAPRAECVGGLKPTFYLDDSNAGPHALRQGMVRCTDPVKETQAPDTKTDAVTQPGTAPPAVTTPPAALPLPLPVLRDVVRPRISKLRATRSRVTFTLSEAARVTVTIERRSGRRLKRIRTFTTAQRAGARTVRFRGRVAASKLRGRLRITVVATDAAGNRSAPLRRSVPS